jgi:hypothetical protein
MSPKVITFDFLFTLNSVLNLERLSIEDTRLTFDFKNVLIKNYDSEQSSNKYDDLK